MEDVSSGFIHKVSDSLVFKRKEWKPKETEACDCDRAPVIGSRYLHQALEKMGQNGQHRGLDSLVVNAYWEGLPFIHGWRGKNKRNIHKVIKLIVCGEKKMEYCHFYIAFQND